MPLFPWQEKVLAETRDREYYGLFWEMRVGKSLPAALSGEHLFIAQQIEAVVVVAPNGVHLNWAKKIIPTLPFYGCLDSSVHFVISWSSSKTKRKKFQEQLAEALGETKKLIWVCANVEALSKQKKKVTDTSLEFFLETLMEKKRTLFIFDESHKLKEPSSYRTKAAIRLSKLAPYRRILTGTPATKSPFNLWSQMHLLSYSIFNMTFTAFKHFFGEWQPVRFGGPVFLQLKNYRNLDKLQSMIEPYTSRLTQREVFPDHVEPIVERAYFELSPIQRRVYNQLRDELIATLDTGQTVTASHAMVCALRLHQIARGYVGGTEDGPVDLGGPFPQLDTLLHYVEQCQGKFIIWCHFVQDVDRVTAFLMENKVPVVRFDGKVPHAKRSEAIDYFTNDPNVRGLVGNPAAGGMGWDMSAADTMIFYSSDYSLENRMQGIARMQGINQKSKALLVIDMVAADTVDERCFQVLEANQDVADIVTGDRLRLMLLEEKRKDV